jgi:hypothetical protein
MRPAPLGLTNQCVRLLENTLTGRSATVPRRDEIVLKVLQQLPFVRIVITNRWYAMLHSSPD